MRRDLIIARDLQGRLALFVQPTRAELLAEWRRRRELCRVEMIPGMAAGDLDRYREARRQWARWCAKNYC